MYSWIKKVERALRLSLRSKSKERISKFDRQAKKFNARYPQYNIGVGSYGIPTVRDWNEGSSLSIGNYCSISSNVEILLGGNHRTDWISTYPFSAYLEGVSVIADTGITKGDVVIGSDVWVCANTVILSGVTVGHGAVIANGAVVTKDVAPYSIVGGNPAKLIGYRFDNDLRERLLKAAWWDWPVDEVKSIYHLLNADDFDGFWSYAETR